MKSATLSIPIFLAVLFLAGCSPPTAPPAATPTPHPIVVKEATPEPTAAPIDLDSNQSGGIDEPRPDESSALSFQPVDEVAVESLSIRILNRFPVEILVTIGGNVEDECLEIESWEQSFSGSTIFLFPLLNRLDDGQCLDGGTAFNDIVDLDLQDRSVTELISEDYNLDVNGFTMNLRLPVSSSLLQEEVSGCPVRGEGEILYLNEEAGFCLLFPETFTIRDDEAPNVVSFYGPPLDEHELEPLRAMLFANYQEQVLGRTLEQIADERRARYEGTDRELIITPDILDGNPALLIEGEGEMANSLRIITFIEDRVFEFSVAPYKDFLLAAGDVELVWDLFLNSFTFLRPTATQEDDQILSLAEFKDLLTEAVSSNDYDLLQALMDDTFGFAFWRSEGYEAAPVEAVERLRLSYLQADQTITFEDTLPDLSAALGEDRDVLSIWDPSTNPVGALFSTGWGPDGGSEAILILTESPEGVIAWDGIILAHGDMGGFTGLEFGG